MAREGLDASVTARTALDLGLDAIVVAAPLRKFEWEPLKALLPGHAAASIELFLPFPSSLPSGAPCPFHAASLDAGERKQALQQGLETVIEAERKEIPVIHLTPIALEVSLREAWLSLQPDQPFVDHRRAQILQRRANEACRRIDSLKSFLGGLLESADRYGRQIAMVPGGFPDEVPSLKEMQDLLREFRGAPLTVWADTLRAAASWPGNPLADWPLKASCSHLTVRDFGARFTSIPLGEGRLNRDWAMPLLEISSLWVLDAEASTSPELLEAGLAGLRALAESPKPEKTANWLGI